MNHKQKSFCWGLVYFVIAVVAATSASAKISEKFIEIEKSPENIEFKQNPNSISAKNHLDQDYENVNSDYSWIYVVSLFSILFGCDQFMESFKKP
ncbi:MAG: hypothetical protein H7196_05235 [candidate division SR1 bacterium]|nr:hypothetical protein [candidate division SR1 bacterium]